MQCPTCEFQNMPGLHDCGRCGARLVAPADETFEPPRATRAQKRVRKLRRLLLPPRPRPEHRSARPGIYAAEPRRNRLGRLLRPVRLFFNADTSVPVWRESPAIAGVLSLLPGLGHLYLKRWRIGLILLPSSLLVFTLAARFYGTAPGNWLAWVYPLACAWAVYDTALRTDEMSIWRNIVAPMAVVIIVGNLLAGPLQKAQQTFGLRYVTFDSEFGPLADQTIKFVDDFDARGGPRHGDMVLVRGPSVGVVLGCPGDLLQWKNELLSVNGAPRPELRPIGFRYNIPDIQIQVPDNRYFVLRAAHGYGNATARYVEEFMRNRGLTDRENLLYRYEGDLLPEDADDQN